jgi:hypothetical protein
MSTRDLAHPKPVLLAGRGSGEISLAWRGSPDVHRYLDSVEIESPGDTIPVGTPFGLRARGISRARNAVPVHSLRWRSLNTDVATIDSSGVVRGVRPRRCNDRGLGRGMASRGPDIPRRKVSRRPHYSPRSGPLRSSLRSRDVHRTPPCATGSLGEDPRTQCTSYRPSSKLTPRSPCRRSAGTSR